MACHRTLFDYFESPFRVVLSKPVNVDMIMNHAEISSWLMTNGYGLVGNQIYIENGNMKNEFKFSDELTAMHFKLRFS